MFFLKRVFPLIVCKLLAYEYGRRANCFVVVLTVSLLNNNMLASVTERRNELQAESSYNSRHIHTITCYSYCSKNYDNLLFSWLCQSSERKFNSSFLTHVATCSHTHTEHWSSTNRIEHQGALTNMCHALKSTTNRTPYNTHQLSSPFGQIA